MTNIINFANNSNNGHNPLDRRMSSREIAIQTGKQHKHVLDAVRKMEPAWEKVNGSRFRLVEYVDTKGEKRPEFQLTKKECLYIATKFNDEARALLLNRWEELELDSFKPQSDAVVLMNAFQILNNMVQEQQKEIAQLTPKADYTDKIVSSQSYFSPTQVGAVFGMTAKALNKFLLENNIIRKIGDNEYTLKAKYLNKGYEYYRPVKVSDTKSVRHLCWTELGRAFIHNLIDPFKKVKNIS